MRASLDVSVSVKPTVHVSDADQSTDAPVALPPSANVSDDSEPEFPAALFQFLACLTPATSLTSIATIPETPPVRPPTKRTLMIIGPVAPPVPAPPVLAPPVPAPPVPAPPVLGRRPR